MTRSGTSAPLAPRRRPVLAFVRRVVWLVVWTAITSLSLVASVLLHLDSQPARDVACDELRAVLNDSLRGTFELDRCVALSWREVRVEGFRALDEDGTVRISVRSLVARPALRTSLAGVPTLDGVVAHVERVDLRDLDALAEIFAAKEPSAPSTDPLVLPDVRVGRVVLDVDAVWLPGELAVEGLAVRGDVSLGPAVRVAGLDVDARIRRDAAAVHVAIDGDVDLGPDAESRVALRADVAEVERLTLDATVRWGETIEAGPWWLRASLEAGVDPELARALEIPELAGLLGGPLALSVQAEGALDALAASGELRAGEQRVALAATLEGETLRASVQTDGLSLSSVMATLPDATVVADLETTLTRGTDGLDLTVRGADLRYDEWSLPLVRGAGTLADDGRFVLRSLDVPHLGGRLEVTGSFGDTIALQVDLDVPSVARDANVRRLAPGVDGRLVVRGALALEGDRVDADLSVTTRGLVAGDVRAEELSLRGTVSGALDRPRVNVALGGRGITVAGERVARLEGTVAGGPRGDGSARYAVVLALEAPSRRVNASLEASLRGETVGLSGDVAATGLWPSRVRATLRDVRTTNGRWDIGRVLVRDDGGAMMVDVGGRFEPSGRSDLHVLADVELAAVDEAFALGLGLRGRGHVEGSVRGSVRSPEALVSATFDDLALGDLPESTVRLELTHTPRVGAQLEASLRGAGTLDVSASLRSESPDVSRLASGELDARVTATSLDLALVGVVAPELPELAGALSLDARVTGPLDAPALAVDAIARELRVGGGDPIEARVATRWAGPAWSSTVAIDDAEGALARVRAELPLTLADARSLDLDGLVQAPFEVDVSLASRRIDTWPQPLRQTVPLLAELELRARGGATGPTVDARVRGAWVGASPASACAEVRPTFDATLAFADDAAQVNATVREREAASGEVRLEARAAVPWRAWLRDGFVIPTVDATLRSEGIALGTLPYVCERASGIARVDVVGQGLLGQTPNVTARVDVDAFRAADGPPMALHLEATAESTHGRMAATLRAPSAAAASVEADAAWDWRWSGVEAPSLDDARWQGAIRFRDAELAPLVAMVPSLEDPTGTLDGAVRATGRGLEGTPEVSGRVELRQVGLTVRDPFLRFERVEGAIAMRDGAIVIENLRYRDLDGSLRVDGRVGLAGLGPDEVRLRVRARELPARVEGVIFAYVTADVRIEGDLASTERRTLDVSLEELSVRVPEESGRNVQSLDRHADVIYEDAWPGGTGRSGVATSEPETADETPADASDETPAVPLAVRVRSTPFWVRRDDFAFQLDADVRATSDTSGTRLEGPLSIRRGYIDLLGKRFDLQPGEIRFSGGATVDPRLELTAMHELRTGEKVYVDIGGYLSAPTLAFRSPDVPAGDDRAVIDLLVRGRPQRDAEIEARDQATSMLAGMLAGFLSSMTRRELGAFLPVFRIEAEDARSARVRAGFQADRLIPSWLEGVVHGIYVEGFVGTEEQSGQTRAAGGFLLELLFPFDLVGAGKWEQGNNWSVDITWEPL